MYHDLSSPWSIVAAPCPLDYKPCPFITLADVSFLFQLVSLTLIVFCPDPLDSLVTSPHNSPRDHFFQKTGYHAEFDRSKTNAMVAYRLQAQTN